MYYDVTRRLELLRSVRLDVFNKQESRPNSCNSILTNSKKQLINIDIEEAGCLKNAWCSKLKKISFLVKCAHFTFLKSMDLKKSKHIHRKVKCAHLVPEPGSR